MAEDRSPKAEFSEARTRNALFGMYEMMVVPAWMRSSRKPASGGPRDCTIKVPEPAASRRASGIERLIGTDVSMSAFWRRTAFGLRVSLDSDSVVFERRRPIPPRLDRG